METASAALDSIRICNACYADGDDQWLAGYSGSGSVCSRCGEYRTTIQVYFPDANEPRLHMEAGARGVEFSTCLDLDHRIIWDSNGYYHMLGVDPKATKQEIRKAYQRLQGHLSDRLTYAVKQLLNDEVRARYDAVKLGDTFFDRYVAEHVRKVIAADVARANAAAGGGPEDGVRIDLDHLMEKPFQMVDNDGASRQGGPHDTDDPFVSHPSVTRSPWGYYRWMSKSTDTRRLAVWRGLIASALREKGATPKIAVGFAGGKAPAVDFKRIGFRWVVFLHDQTEPNEVTAQVVASRVVSIIPTTEQGQKI